MSMENEEQLPVVQPDDLIMESSGKPKRCYTRDFLLSLSELEVCRKLPSGFDKSLLSEFEESSHGIPDRQRVLGASSFQGFRRTEYGSSPPAKGDSGSYSRGLNRWDSRSSGRSDTDSESESGRRYGSQARRAGPNPEHDGLLGSGSFPRPSGFAAGASVPRFRTNGNLPINRSNEPYQPPRPYKATPHSRRETDSLNDETFGSTDSTSEDRAEEEKKRRAEFELMRKEQHKVLQEKQKTGKVEDAFSEITGLLENTSDCKTSSDSDKVLKQPAQSDSGKLPVPAAAPPSRPLVPPGFVSSVVDKSTATKSLVHGDQLEVGKSESEESHHGMKSIAKERGSSDLRCETTNPSAVKSEKVLNLPSVLQAADHEKASSLTDVDQVLENGEIIGLGPDVTGHKLLNKPGRSTSILEKLFGNALTASSGSISNHVEVHEEKEKTEESCSPSTLQSKFAHWFLEEDKKPLEDISPAKPNDLLSLIVGGEKGGSDVSDVRAGDPLLPPETLLGRTAKAASSTAEISEQYSTRIAPEPKPVMLTCEDLEQSILSEVGGNSSKTRPAGQESHTLDVKSGHPGAPIDNIASQHLLSLLQKGTESKNMTSILAVEEESPHKPCPQVGKIDAIDGNTGSGDIEGVNSSGNSLTLETLFGTAFMKELHSTQTNSVGSARTDVSDSPGLAFLTSDSVRFPTAMSETGNGMGSQDRDILASNDGMRKLDRIGNWWEFQDPGKEAEFSKLPAQVGSKFGCIDGGIEVRLPEEDSLISLGDPINPNNSIMVPDSSSSRADFLSSSSNVPANVLEKLAVLGAARQDERSMTGGQDPLLHGPYDMTKPGYPYQNLHPQASSQQVHAPQMNHGKPLFHPLDSRPAHLDPHSKFMPPESIIHGDGPMHHQFPANMGHPLAHQSAGLQGFDHPIPPPILQQMHMTGNLPPPHLARGFSGGAPMPPHPSHNHAGYIQEHNPMQSFPFGQRQPNFGGPRMAPPDIGSANSPPEAFQRLLEMELRANPKQMHPFAGAGHSRSMYEHELDMGFRYR